MLTNDLRPEKPSDAPLTSYQIRGWLKLTDGQTAGSWILADAALDLQEVR